MKVTHTSKVLITLTCSLLLFQLGPIIDQTIRWSNHMEGFVVGLFHTIFTSIAWFIIVLPWSIGILYIYHKFSFKRFRSLWLIAPSLVVFIFTLTCLLTQPPTPSSRFERTTKVHFPINTTDLTWHFSGGGISDYYDIYTFSTTPDEVDRLIQSLNMESNSSVRYSSTVHLPFKQSDIVLEYSSWDENEHWFYNLSTNKEKTKVRIEVGCI